LFIKSLRQSELVSSLLVKLSVLTAVAALCITVLAACGGTNKNEESTKTEASSNESVDLQGVKQYLLDHTSDLTQQTTTLKEKGNRYFEIAKENDFNYQRILDNGKSRREISALLNESKDAWKKANPAYEEAEGVVAGVPTLAEYDVILDAGSDASDPESAVPFNLELPNGKTVKQPGNLFFLTETTLYGTSDKYLVKGVEADLNGDGKEEFGEGLPEANFYKAAATAFDKFANELADAAQKWEPTESDVLTAIAVMTPTMSEYFAAWKNSRAIAGDSASEQGFVGASRLQDIVDILSGISFTYNDIKPLIEKEDPQQAEQIAEDLESLIAYVEDLEKREASGTKFTAEQADTFGSEAQSRAEAIAGQISQAAEQLDIEIQQ